MYEKVLVPTDGSENAIEAAEHAIEIARGSNATLHVLSVIETRTVYDNAIVDPETVRRNLREEAERAVEAIEEEARAAGVETATTVEPGVAHETILAYADEHGVDLIVMGARGRSAFKTVLLGSTTEALLRSAYPVLVVGQL